MFFEQQVLNVYVISLQFALNREKNMMAARQMFGAVVLFFMHC